MSADKDTKGKPPLSILPLAGLIPAAEAGIFGASKYGRYNFHKGHLNTDIVDAILRHIHKYNEGQDFDVESGIHHLGHAIYNAMMILKELELGTLIEGRAASSKHTAGEPGEPDYTLNLHKGIAKMEFSSSGKGIGT